MAPRRRTRPETSCRAAPQTWRPLALPARRFPRPDRPAGVELHLAIDRILGHDGEAEAAVQAGCAVVPGDLEPQWTAGGPGFVDQLANQVRPGPGPSVSRQNRDVDEPDVIRG